MRLLVDEDTQARRLLDALRQAGHDVLSVAEWGGNGLPDAQVFAHAQHQQRVLLTHNVVDFLALARQAPQHAGVLAIFRDGDPRKTMGYADIVRAIGALEAAQVPVPAQFHILNHWR